MMSIRNYNSTKTYGSFSSRRPQIKTRRRNIDYTEIYKLDGAPTHDVEALQQFAEKREEYQRLQNILKRRKEQQQIKTLWLNV